MWAMQHASSDSTRPRIAMEVGRSRAWPGVRRWCNTERLGRDQDRPARVLAARDLAKARVQARVQRNPLHRDGPMRSNAIAERAPTVVVWLRPHNAPALLRASQIKASEASNPKIARLQQRTLGSCYEMDAAAGSPRPRRKCEPAEYACEVARRMCPEIDQEPDMTRSRNKSIKWGNEPH